MQELPDAESASAEPEAGKQRSFEKVFAVRTWRFERLGIVRIVGSRLQNQDAIAAAATRPVLGVQANDAPSPLTLAAQRHSRRSALPQDFNDGSGPDPRLIPPRGTEASKK